jgi:hypothetical protein
VSFHGSSVFSHVVMVLRVVPGFGVMRFPAFLNVFCVI